MIDIQRLYEKYLTLEIPNPFTLEQIHNRLTEAYYAEQVDLNIFSSLRFDPEAGFDQALAAYVFKDERGIQKILKLNNDEEIHEPLEFAWIINSTLQGFSHMLVLEIDVLRGKIEEEEMYLGNLPFEEYLITLYLTGHIQFEDDLFIDKLAARFQEGYRLRYFGMQNGDEKYLYK
ncbi:pyruvate kinase [Paenibacillus sp. UMB7766-LJ446]|uniref:pyruvate kinase n=1 Tax=Paenibacillus sp. UMB7766-LJ446 TaxID=3046313 RepID=UPI00254D19C2|nr:pyruvate kinase [Paenibacillus sp. UMB7766-LJ446]MDK8193100.1 pyruvate kinase [Paenibacillus sp. UMB7766-LJ446]